MDGPWQKRNRERRKQAGWHIWGSGLCWAVLCCVIQALDSRVFFHRTVHFFARIGFFSFVSSLASAALLHDSSFSARALFVVAIAVGKPAFHVCVLFLRKTELAADGRRGARQHKQQGGKGMGTWGMGHGGMGGWGSSCAWEDGRRTA